jgi:Flagellar hook-length control protein FliK
MALASTQSSISDLFAPRANDTRLSGATKRRYETAGDAGFGAVFANYSAPSKAKVTDRSAVASESKSETRSSKPASKLNSDATSRVATQEPSRSHSEKSAKRTAKQESATTTEQRDSNVSLRSDQEHADKSSIKQNSPDAAKSQGLTADGQRSSATNAIEGIGSAGAAELLIAESNLLRGANAVSSIVDAAVVSELNQATTAGGAQAAFTSAGLSISGEGKVEAQGELAVRMFEQNPDINNMSEMARGNLLVSPKAPMEQSSVNQPVSLTGGADLRSMAELMKSFDVQKLADAAVASGNSLGTDNLKALEQLNSVKLVAPTVVRALMAQRQDRRDVAPKSQAVTPQNPTSAIQTSGVMANSAIEALNALPQGQNITKEFFSLGQPGLDVGGPDSKSPSLEAALQLQAERGESRLASESKDSRAVGKLVVPEKFGAVLKSGVQSLRLQIAPKHLGTAELTVKLIKDHVQGTLTVTSEAARVAALNSMESLAQRLSDEGLILDSLDVEVSQDGANQERNELERQYADVLQSGLIQRAFESSDEYSQFTSVEQSARPFAINTVSAANVDTHA